MPPVSCRRMTRVSTRLLQGLRRIRYSIPFRVRLRVGNVLFYPYDKLRRHRDRPPWMRIFVGTGDFDAIGRTAVDSLRGFGLTSQSHFLDVGSGMGRVALPLTEFLAPSAIYAGFDVVPEFVEWCRMNITPRHPNFTFYLVEERNSEYNPESQIDARHRYASLLTTPHSILYI